MLATRIVPLRLSDISRPQRGHLKKREERIEEGKEQRYPFHKKEIVDSVPGRPD